MVCTFPSFQTLEAKAPKHTKRSCVYRVISKHTEINYFGSFLYRGVENSVLQVWNFDSVNEHLENTAYLSVWKFLNIQVKKSTSQEVLFTMQI